VSLTPPNPLPRSPAPSDPLRPGYRRGSGPTGLADVLERVLDKGIVVAGDIQLNLLDIEVLTLKIRLLIASADTAQQMGVDWWKEDPFLSTDQRALERENELLRERLRELTAAAAGGGAPAEFEGGNEELLRRLARLEHVVARRLGPVADRELDEDVEREALADEDVARTSLAEDGDDDASGDGDDS
jgi:hypothetical protein